MTFESVRRLPKRLKQILAPLAGNTATAHAMEAAVADQPIEAAPASLERTRTFLEAYLERAGIPFEGRTSEHRGDMAAVTAALPRRELPEGFRIIHVGPGDENAARAYYDVAVQSLSPNYVLEPYTHPERDERHLGYYLGLYSDGEHPETVVCTMQVANYGNRGEVAVPDILTTAPDWRGRGFAAALLTNVLLDDYAAIPVTWLHRVTDDGRPMYESLQFLELGESQEPSQSAETE